MTDKLPSLKTDFAALGGHPPVPTPKLTLSERATLLARNFGLMAHIDIGSQETLNKNLQKAAQKGSLQQLKIWHGVGGDVQGDYNRALKFAILAGSAACVQYLIEQGADENDQWQLDLPRPETNKTYDSITALTVADSLLVTSLNNPKDRALQNMRAQVRSLLKTPQDQAASSLHVFAPHIDVVKPA